MHAQCYVAFAYALDGICKSMKLCAWLVVTQWLLIHSPRCFVLVGLLCIPIVKLGGMVVGSVRAGRGVVVEIEESGLCSTRAYACMCW